MGRDTIKSASSDLNCWWRTVIHPPRRPFPEGNGFFETMRTENSQVAEFGRHMRRALSAARATGIRLPNEELLREAVAKVLIEEPHELGRLRLSVTKDGFTITHDPYTEMAEGGYLTFSPHTSKSVGAQYKTFPYESRYEIVDEARAYGFDDAMVFNSKNNVTETGISNLAFLIDQTWFTPPISAGILPGVMRAVAIERCGVQVRNIHISEIPNASEVFLLSSLKIAQPVIQIGEHRLACGAASQAFSAQMREKVEYFSVG